MAVAVPYIIMGASALMSAKGQLDEGSAAEASAKSEAAQLRTEAIQDEAVSQRKAAERKRQMNLNASRALALASASGGGALDANVVDILSGFAEEADYGFRSALFEGESIARKKRYGADVREKEGKAAKSASKWKAASTILGAAGSMYGAYGAKTPGLEKGLGTTPRNTNYSQLWNK